MNERRSLGLGVTTSGRVKVQAKENQPIASLQNQYLEAKLEGGNQTVKRSKSINMIKK